MEFLRKYKWFLITIALLYMAIAIWLFFFTSGPQEVPFEYQIS